jgi:microcystin degradation protein MlrC
MKNNMRIAIAGISHESLNFSPIKTTIKDFQVWHSNEIINKYSSIGKSLSGSVKDSDFQFDELFKKIGAEPVPIFYANGLAPSGIVEEKTYIQFRDEILRGISEAGNLDGICLILHGALLVENIWSGETDLVRSIRSVVGNDVLISARFDLHGNLTEEFANKTDLWTVYRTAPHRDQLETLKRSLILLSKCLRENLNPKPIFIHLPLLLPGEKATTDVEPMKSLLKLVKEIEQQDGILTAEILVGFGWADSYHAGSSVTVIAKDVKYIDKAKQGAKILAQAMWNERYNFSYDQEVALSVDDAIDLAVSASEKTVFISDSGDNITAGTPGDNPFFLSRMIAKKISDAVFAGIPDNSALQKCFKKGIGSSVNLKLGGKLDTKHGKPVNVTGIIKHLYKSEQDEDEAAIATLKINGLFVLVTDKRKYFSTIEDFNKAGIDPLKHKIVVVKLGYLMPELRDIAPREILALSPGYSNMELNRLPFKFVNRPIFPLDKAFNWEPVI